MSKSVNAVFSPTPEEIAWAREVMESAESRDAPAGRALYSLNGQMVDEAIVKRARAPVAGRRRLMDFALTAEQEQLRQAVAAVCARFSEPYWQELDREKRYPEEFVKALTDGGWLATLIPTEYGGAGLGMIEASLVLEEINASGGNGAACHAAMYTMGALVRHGSEEQKRRYLPELASSGRLRLQSMAVTEPQAGSDTSRITTFARKQGDGYVLNGQKVFTSRVQHSDLMLVLARTTPVDQVTKEDRGDEPLPGRPAPGRSLDRGAADRDNGQPRDQRRLHDRSRAAGGGACRSGGSWLSPGSRRSRTPNGS